MTVSRKHLSILRSSSFLLVTTFVLLVFLAPTSVSATDLTVICQTGGPGAYASINAALNALPLQGPNSITVTGTCTENIFLAFREQLLITAGPGQSATIASPDPNQTVLATFSSHGIVLTNLVFQGGAAGVDVSQGTEITLNNCTMQQNSSDGLLVETGSTAIMENGTMQNNGGNGMTVTNTSTITLATMPGEQILVQGNAGDGIDVDGSSLQVNFGVLTIQNNQGAALGSFGGRLLIFGGVGTGNVFQNNGEGVDVFNGGSASFFGKNTINANGDVGLQVLASSVVFNSKVAPDGTVKATVIEGHATLGVNVVRMGELTFNGPHTVTNNGSLTADPTLVSGIRVNRGSLTLNRGVQVSGNNGPGIRVEQNSGILTNGAASIVNNTQAGVLVTLQSEATFPVTPVFSGNGVASIACDSTSLVSGQLAGIANIECSQIARQQGPPRPGRILF